MAITYEIFDNGQTLLSRVVGSVTEREWIRYREYLATNVNIKQGFHELIDLLGISSVDFTSQSMERITELKRNHADTFANRRGAIVVSDSNVFDMARNFEKLDMLNNEQTTVFNHLDTALTWLGVSLQAKQAAKSDKPLANTFAIDGFDVDNG